MICPQFKRDKVHRLISSAGDLLIETRGQLYQHTQESRLTYGLRTPEWSRDCSTELSHLNSLLREIKAHQAILNRVYQIRGKK